MCVRISKFCSANIQANKSLVFYFTSIQKLQIRKLPKKMANRGKTSFITIMACRKSWESARPKTDCNMSRTISKAIDKRRAAARAIPMSKSFRFEDQTIMTNRLKSFVRLERNGREPEWNSKILILICVIVGFGCGSREGGSSLEWLYDRSTIN